MIDPTPISIGTRVRLRSASHVVDLRSDTGRVVRFDPIDGMPVIRLDAPAVYHEADGGTRDLSEIVEAEENIEVLEDEAQAVSSEGEGQLMMHDEAIEGCVRQWLTEAGFRVEPADAGDARFNVVAIDPSGMNINIVRGGERPGELLLMTYVSFDGPMLDRLLALAKRASELLKIELAIELVRLGARSSYAEPPMHPLQQIMLGAEIYDEELTKFGLVQRVMLVRRALQLTRLMIERATLPEG